MAALALPTGASVDLLSGLQRFQPELMVQVSPVVATYPLITIGLNRLIHGDRSMGPRGLIGSLISVAGVVAVILG